MTLMMIDPTTTVGTMMIIELYVYSKEATLIPGRTPTVTFSVIGEILCNNFERQKCTVLHLHT